MRDQVIQAVANDQRAKQQIEQHDRRRQMDDPARKTAPKDRPEQEAKDRQEDRHHQLPVPVRAQLVPEGAWEKRHQRFVGVPEVIEQPLPGRLGIIDEVFRGIGHGERARDHEVGRGKPEQNQDQQFANPAGDRPLEQPGCSLPVRRAARDIRIDRQGAEKGKQDNNDRCQGRQEAGGLERDGRLVCQTAEIVDADEAEDQEPGGLQGSCLAGGVI